MLSRYPWICACQLFLFSVAGCFSYTYHDRGPGPTFSKVDVDENLTRSELRWSSFWGGQEDVWKPIGCQYADGTQHLIGGDRDPSCVSYFELCPYGIGRFDVKLLFYSVPLAVLTLGMVMPAQTTAYCATSPKDVGPGGPSAPDGPSGPSGPDE